MAVDRKCKTEDKEVVPTKVPRYDALLACYRSGQFGEKEWKRLLEAEHFAAWLKKHGHI